MPRSTGTVRAIRRAGQQGRVKSQLQGVASVRKLLRNMPASVKNEMADTLVDIAPEYLAAVKADTPVATRARVPGHKLGSLRDAITAKVLRSSLRLRVGLLGRKKLLDLFYGRIVELGRKSKTVTIKRGPRAGAKMRIRERAPQHFVYKARPELRTRLNNRLNSFWEHALQHAGEGTDIDG